jgi:hypothetical protein
MWSHRKGAGLHRVTARIVPNEALDAPAVVAHGRLVVLGGDDGRLHEEITAAGGFLREGRLSRINVGQTEAALQAVTSGRPSNRVTARFVEAWPRIREGVMGALEARVRERASALQRQLEEQRDREVADLRTILEELARTIREELATSPPLQPELPFSEKRQLELDREAIRARLDAIPDEIARESAQILKRYAAITPRLFPVAVTFLVPERLAH